MVDGILCDDDGLARFDRVVVALAREVRDTRSPIVAIDEIVFWCELNGFAWVDSIDTQGQSIKVFHLIRRIEDGNILVVIVHLVHILHSPSTYITIPIVAYIEHFLYD